jgi:hypothetical protein
MLLTCIRGAIVGDIGRVGGAGKIAGMTALQVISGLGARCRRHSGQQESDAATSELGDRQVRVEASMAGCHRDVFGGWCG